MMYVLRVAGAPAHTQRKANWSWLCDQALLLAERGYTCTIAERDAPGIGLEIARRDGQVVVAPFDNNIGYANPAPPWRTDATTWLTNHIRRRASL